MRPLSTARRWLERAVRLRRLRRRRTREESIARIRAHMTELGQPIDDLSDDEIEARLVGYLYATSRVDEVLDEATEPTESAAEADEDEVGARRRDEP